MGLCLRRQSRRGVRGQSPQEAGRADPDPDAARGRIRPPRAGLTSGTAIPPLAPRPRVRRDHRRRPDGHARRRQPPGRAGADRQHRCPPGGRGRPDRPDEPGQGQRSGHEPCRARPGEHPRRPADRGRHPRRRRHRAGVPVERCGDAGALGAAGSRGVPGDRRDGRLGRSRGAGHRRRRPPGPRRRGPDPVRPEPDDDVEWQGQRERQGQQRQRQRERPRARAGERRCWVRYDRATERRGPARGLPRRGRRDPRVAAGGAARGRGGRVGDGAGRRCRRDCDGAASAGQGRAGRGPGCRRRPQRAGGPPVRWRRDRPAVAGLRSDGRAPRALVRRAAPVRRRRLPRAADTADRSRRLRRRPRPRRAGDPRDAGTGSRRRCGERSIDCRVSRPTSCS